jgi:hypothetical protein
MIKKNKEKHYIKMIGFSNKKTLENSNITCTSITYIFDN